VEVCQAWVVCEHGESKLEVIEAKAYLLWQVRSCLTLCCGVQLSSEGKNLCFWHHFTHWVRKELSLALEIPVGEGGGGAQ